jgi:hypothetical protein
MATLEPPGPPREGGGGDKNYPRRDVTPNVHCEASLERVCALTGRDMDWVRGMVLHRQGSSEDANMTALGLHKVVQRSDIYEVSSSEGLRVASPGEEPIDMDARAKERQKAATAPTAPTHAAEIEGLWDRSDTIDGGTENILGDNVVFHIVADAAGRTTDSAAGFSTIDIPVLGADTPAGKEAMAYYGAVLLSEGDVVKFPNTEYPLWKMQLGVSYVDGFIMTPQGKGFYIEYHHDRPHWHQPLTADSGGYYLLARAFEKENNSNGSDGGKKFYHMTGFHIPFGKAVYTSQGAIHCDAALTGSNWLVGYTDSHDFSTALIRNQHGQFVKLAGVPR